MRREYQNRRDGVAATIVASTASTPIAPFIGNARSAVTIFDLARRIKALSGCSGEIVFQPLHYTDVELRIPNVDKARERLIMVITEVLYHG